MKSHSVPKDYIFVIVYHHRPISTPTADLNLLTNQVKFSFLFPRKHKFKSSKHTQNWRRGSCLCIYVCMSHGQSHMVKAATPLHRAMEYETRPATDDLRSRSQGRRLPSICDVSFGICIIQVVLYRSLLRSSKGIPGGFPRHASDRELKNKFFKRQKLGWRKQDSRTDCIDSLKDSAGKKRLKLSISRRRPQYHPCRRFLLNWQQFLFQTLRTTAAAVTVTMTKRSFDLAAAWGRSVLYIQGSQAAEGE